MKCSGQCLAQRGLTVINPIFTTEELRSERFLNLLRPVTQRRQGSDPSRADAKVQLLHHYTLPPQSAYP